MRALRKGNMCVRMPAFYACVCSVPHIWNNKAAGFCLLIAPFYYLNQPLAHNTFITQMAHKQHNRIPHRACSKHLLSIQSTLQAKPALCLFSTDNSILALQCDTSQVMPQHEKKHGLKKRIDFEIWLTWDGNGHGCFQGPVIVQVPTQPQIPSVLVQQQQIELISRFKLVP